MICEAISLSIDSGIELFAWMQEHPRSLFIHNIYEHIVFEYSGKQCLLQIILVSNLYEDSFSF